MSAVTKEHEQFRVAQGNILRELRGKKYSQDMLAERLGVTRQQISRYENGTRDLSGYEIYLIADILGIPPQQLFTGIPQILASEKQMKELFSILSLCKPEEIRLLINAAKGLVENR